MPVPVRLFASLVVILVVPLARAVSVVPPTLEELVSEADVVVRGIVTEVRGVEFDSPQGRGIRTIVTLRVERTLKGSAGETVTLLQLGGTVRGRTLRVAGLPQFKPGDRQIVFVAGNGRMICPVIGGVFGRFFVRVDAATGRDQIFRNDGAPLVSIADIPSPFAVRPPPGPSFAGGGMAGSEFESRIVSLAASLPPTPRTP